MGRKKTEKSKPPILKQTKMGVNLKLYFELNDIMSEKVGMRSFIPIFLSLFQVSILKKSILPLRNTIFNIIGVQNSFFKDFDKPQNITSEGVCDVEKVQSKSSCIGGRNFRCFLVSADLDRIKSWV